MPPEISFTAALMVGLLGSTHCIGMCGGIAGAAALAAGPRPHAINRMLYPTIYNLGRISSYVIAGYLAASLGSLGYGVAPPAMIGTLASVFTFVFLFSLGLYLAGWWSFLPRLEALGQHLWRRIEPMGRKLLPIRHPGRAFLFGLVWGWLPCGLVYSVLAWALATGHPQQGALVMLGFGLGTLPTMLTLGAAGQTLRRLRTLPATRRLIGLSLVLLALIMLASNLSHRNERHHETKGSDSLLSQLFMAKRYESVGTLYTSWPAAVRDIDSANRRVGTLAPRAAVVASTSRRCAATNPA